MNKPSNETKKPKKRITVGQIISGIITALMLIMIAFLVYSMYAGANQGNSIGIGGIKFLNVLTGSMEPMIHPGDLIITKTVGQDELAVGDVVTFKVSESADTVLLTHRIVGIDEKGYITRGDANNTDDPGWKTYSQVVGKYIFKIPKVGSALNYLSTPRGIVLMGIIFFAYVLIEAVVKYFFQKKQNHTGQT